MATIYWTPNLFQIALERCFKIFWPRDITPYINISIYTYSFVTHFYISQDFWTLPIINIHQQMFIQTWSKMCLNNMKMSIPKTVVLWINNMYFWPHGKKLLLSYVWIITLTHIFFSNSNSNLEFSGFCDIRPPYTRKWIVLCI